MNKIQNLKTVAAVERERESLFIQHGIRLLDHTWGCLLENKGK